MTKKILICLPALVALQLPAGAPSQKLPPQAALVRGVVYQPYYLAMFVACAGVTWLSPQTWDFTRVLPAWKVAWATAVLWLAMMILGTQSYNPFIYFIF
jgi:hypothetical protein